MREDVVTGAKGDGAVDHAGVRDRRVDRSGHEVAPDAARVGEVAAELERGGVIERSARSDVDVAVESGGVPEVPARLQVVVAEDLQELEAVEGVEVEDA